MKHEIQQKLLKETSGLTAEERNRRLEKALAEDPLLGPFLKNNGAKKRGSSKSINLLFPGLFQPSIRSDYVTYPGNAIIWRRSVDG